MLYIHPVSILTPARRLERGAVLIDGGRIAAVGTVEQVARPPGAQTLDASGLILASGFIDLQLNGAFGCDFTAAPETIWEVAARLPQYGVTAFLPTIISSPPETAVEAQAVLRRGPPPGFQGAQPLGLHLEGPFLNPAKRGAHDPRHLRLPDREALRDWSPQQGVRLVTLAPELPGAHEVIRELSDRGVVVSAGHSMATYEQALAGFEAGITYGTHLFNAMPPLEHRAPGLAGALLADERAAFGLIADGVHVHRAAVALAWRAAGPARFNLVTDAMAALARRVPPGHYTLGDREVIVDGASARLGDGRLAGSLLSLDQAVRNLIAYVGCSPEEAVGSVTEVPARVLGLANERGRIAPGCAADLVLLTQDLQLKATIVSGELVWGDL